MLPRYTFRNVQISWILLPYFGVNMMKVLTKLHYSNYDNILELLEIIRISHTIYFFYDLSENIILIQYLYKMLRFAISKNFDSIKCSSKVLQGKKYLVLMNRAGKWSKTHNYDMIDVSY